MDGLRVSELAERAGLAPSTVRFYERAGLLPPARRAASGCRVFDESALDELAFISRAKGLGMSLDDIAALVASWPPGECRLLQARLRAFLAGRISQARQQAAEMGAFERLLAAAATSAERTGGTVRLVLPADPETITAVAALCAAETACCPQARFLLEVTAGQVTVTAEAAGTTGLPEALSPASAPSP